MFFIPPILWKSTCLYNLFNIFQNTELQNLKMSFEHETICQTNFGTASKLLAATCELESETEGWKKLAQSMMDSDQRILDVLHALNDEAQRVDEIETREMLQHKNRVELEMQRMEDEMKQINEVAESDRRVRVQLFDRCELAYGILRDEDEGKRKATFTRQERAQLQKSIKNVFYKEPGKTVTYEKPPAIAPSDVVPN